MPSPRNIGAAVQRLQQTVQGFMDEPALAMQGQLSTLQRFVHFWILVGRSFIRNRCPIRASSLSYTTLLALVPLLAVVFSVTSSLLKKEGEQRIEQFIERMVASLTGPGLPVTNQPPAQETSGPLPPTPQDTTEVPAAPALASAAGSDTNAAAIAVLVQGEKAVAVRKDAAKRINEFIQNARSGTLGVTGMIVLVFVVISLMASIEATFNDIWGVTQGRTWFTKVILYWTTVTLGPLLLIAGMGLLSGAQAASIRGFIADTAILGNLIFKVLPLLMLWLAFTLFYQLMPATQVQWSAAAVGGLVGSLLWSGNNLLAFAYASRWVTASKIYGSLALVPIVMAGLYLSWLILLFGAQVSYAWQNRALYLQERLAEQVNQRRREFVALRLMTAIGQQFQHGERPATIPELSAALGIPSRLVQQVMQTLLSARLVIEVGGRDGGYTPARPLDTINCHDLLHAMRSTNGQALATRDEPARAEVFGEFARIQEAERTAAASVTLLALVNRAQARLALAAPEAADVLSPAEAIAARPLPAVPAPAPSEPVPPETPRGVAAALPPDDPPVAPEIATNIPTLPDLPRTPTPDPVAVRAPDSPVPAARPFAGPAADSVPD